MRSWYALSLAVVFAWAATSAQVPEKQESSLIGPMVTFDPAHQKPITYQDQAVEATLIVGRERHSLKIVHRAMGSEKRVPLPEEMAQVDEIRAVVGGRLVVRGMVNGSGSEVAVFEVTSGRLQDKFLCYMPAISPGGRYIAFGKFYPLHFSEGTEDHYMLYDLAKEPARNRPVGVPKDDMRDVGVTVYPVGIGNKPGDNLRRPEGTGHESRSFFFWNPNGTEFVFADQAQGNDWIDLVLVDIGSDGKVTVRTAQQPMAPLCSILKDPKMAKSCSLLIRKVDFRTDPEWSLSVVFEIVDVRAFKTIQYTGAQFH